MREDWEFRTLDMHPEIPRVSWKLLRATWFGVLGNKRMNNFIKVKCWS
jgi:hypothetical protein